MPCYDCVQNKNNLSKLTRVKVDCNRDLLLHASFTLLLTFFWHHLCDPRTPQLKSISHSMNSAYTSACPTHQYTHAHTCTHMHTHTPSHALLWLSPSLLVSIECLTEHPKTIVPPVCVGVSLSVSTVRASVQR